MSDISPIGSRKADHIRINLEQDVRSGLTTGLENYRFVHEALPDLDLDQIDLSQVLFNKKISAPILISSMTGGTPEAALINLNLAAAAQQAGIALGLGSQRAGLEHPELVTTFQVRQAAPDVLLFANLGAIQLNYRYTVDQCRRAIDMVQADALILHLNPLQEALQPEGDTHFAGLLEKIEAVCRHLEAPVIVKEVGWGISERCARQLASAGVSAIDVAGAGGTSWSQVELFRVKNEGLAQVAAAFRNWGIPTAMSLQQVRKAAPDLLTFASGGLKDGIDIAKCIALGASLGGMAGPFLKPASESSEAVGKMIQVIQRGIQVCMFASGCANLAQLKNAPLIHSVDQGTLCPP